jgi:hypothetical protein
LQSKAPNQPDILIHIAESKYSNPADDRKQAASGRFVALQAPHWLVIDFLAGGPF